ncbi:MAG: hypothetical protein EU535_08470 [Promethearchaeota archaeon]|nr:MAG: hypothetical protein EU535_08470 [Candidatus Lokiarchaeota archaeon]
MREKFKQSSGDLLSKSMEIDKLLKKIDAMVKNQNTLESNGQDVEAKNQEIEGLKEKINQLEQKQQESQEIIKGYETQVKQETSLKETDVISSIEKAISQVKQILPEGRSTIRLVLPEIEDLKKYDLLDVLKQIPGNVIINIATKIGDPFGDPFVRDVKNFCQLTNYSDKQFIAVNIDSSKFLIGLIKGDAIDAVYTEVSEFVDIFKQAIMEPFVKGKRVF